LILPLADLSSSHDHAASLGDDAKVSFRGQIGKHMLALSFTGLTQRRHLGVRGSAITQHDRFPKTDSCLSGIML
jgi:hypothetical protein